MATVDSSAEATARPRRRLVLWLLLLPLAVVLAIALAFRSRGHSGSQAILERLRAAGYPTTLPELDRWYAAVPDAENVALVILAAADELPSRENSALPFIGSTKAPSRGNPWDPDMVRSGREYLDAGREPLTRLIDATGLERSRYPISLTNGYDLKLVYLGRLKGVAQALALKAGVEGEEGRTEMAARSAGAVFLVGRSLDAEPLLISHLVRMATDAIGVGAIERLLNRADLPDASLAGLESVVLSAATNRGLERGLVGETCIGLSFFSLSPSKLAQAMAPTPPGATGSRRPNAARAAQDLAGSLYAAAGLKAEDERFYLDLMERMIGATKLEWWQARKSLDHFESETIGAKMQWYRGRVLSSMLLPALLKAQVRDARSRAGLRCALVALAVERYRHANGSRLPESLAELVPAFLAEVPMDPFTGQSLHLLRRDRGYVVYSFGPDGDDDDGKEFKPGANMGDDFDVTFTVER